MSTYTGQGDQERMRKTNLCPELNAGLKTRLLSGDSGSVSGVLVCWSLDLGSTSNRSLSFSFSLDHLGLCMLIHLYQVN